MDKPGIVNPHPPENASRILIVDDNPDKRDLLAILLQREHFVVMQAESGQKAFKLMQEVKPDVILLDALMPGMNGYEVCSNLKLDPDLVDIPVLFVTVLDQDESRIRGLHVGADDFISWPINSKELIARVNARIRSRRPLLTLRRDLEQQGQELQEQRAENQQTNFELERARLIQRQLLSLSFPQGRGVLFAERYRPSRKVGGDFYDVAPLDSGEIFLMMADVSGHGIPAAMLIGLLKAVFRTGTRDHGNPQTLLCWLNKEIARYLSTGEFLTVFLGLWKPESRCLQYAGAGHPPPLLITPGAKRVERLNVANGIIGAGLEKDFTQTELILEAGQRLLCYTDGITEAMNSSQDLFGEERLADVCTRWMDRPIDELVKIVLAEVDVFSQGACQQDDQAVLAMEVVQ
jgi:phosphoserine phosphatase RsbU/P